MGLDEYRRKRDRARTPEPFAGEAGGDSPVFVVQRHAARRLHYDFRLERGGALASWAVPKGIPLERGERRLAVHVEDHPLAYASFEGEIPAGQYGAGSVEIWDSGTYELVEEKRDGGLTVRLHGRRLDGTWTLVPAGLDGDPKNWLLLRKDGAEPGRSSYTPMLATASESLPAGEGWSFEPKWDGYRAIVTIAGGEARLVSRNGNDLTGRFASLARAVALAVRSPDAVLDAEVCALDGRGRSSFSLLQRGEGDLALVVFDLLELDGEPRVDEPLARRRELLAAAVVPDSGAVIISPAFDDGEALLRAAEEQGLEGVLAKRLDARYQTGRRSPDWRKVKLKARQEFVVAGYTRGSGRRAGTFGALILGVRDGDALVFAGSVGAGFGDAELERLSALLRPLERKTSPFATAPRIPRVKQADVTWVEPALVVEVSFAEWTRDGLLRAPVYVGQREDRAPADVRRERAAIEPELQRGRRSLKLSNLDKPFWPEEGISKGDLLGYYRDIAPVLVPHLRGRPFTMKRYPDGWAGKHFFQKDAPASHAGLDPDRALPRLDAVGRDSDDRLPARRRRARSAVGGEHGLHRHERLDGEGRPAGAPGLGDLRPRSVGRGRLRGGRRDGAARQGGARPPLVAELPQDERLARHPRARSHRAAPHLRGHAVVRLDRRIGSRPRAPRARDDGMGEAEAPRRPRRREPERDGEDDGERVLRPPARRGARIDAASLGGGEGRARPGSLHDGRGARPGCPGRRPLRPGAGAAPVAHRGAARARLVGERLPPAAPACTASLAQLPGMSEVGAEHLGDALVAPERRHLAEHPVARACEQPAT